MRNLAVYERTVGARIVTLGMTVNNIEALGELAPRSALEKIKRAPNPARELFLHARLATVSSAELFENILHAANFRRNYEMPHYLHSRQVRYMVQNWDDALAAEFKACLDDLAGRAYGGGAAVTEALQLLAEDVARKRESQSGAAELERIVLMEERRNSSSMFGSW